ncbi:MAG: 5'-methylthioadenosine/S-adenosylhomocysteine nucleosidase [Proteobacteria bacterium]|nr:5'-methylthioadenosine/S-adenosylhomocysteine nucleosidase [Pseudomonadota bacterium]
MCDASIALLYAMPKEIDSLLRESPGASLIMTVAGVNFYIISGDIIAVTGGIGKVNAAMAAQLVIERFHVSTIINVGVAGCFQNVDIGTLILADKFVQHDVDTSGCGDPVGLVSTVNTVEFPTSALQKARTVLDSIGHPYLVGTGATGDWFAIRGDRAKWINDTFHPLFIEMEGAAVAQVCLRNDVAFLALKSVSDCLFGNDKYDFNFPKAMENLNAIALKFARMING